MKRLVIKVIAFLMIVAFLSVVSQTISPLVANSLAMYQMESYTDSSLWIQIYFMLLNYKTIVLLIVAMLLFYKDIKKIFKSKGERNKDEK